MLEILREREREEKAFQLEKEEGERSSQPNLVTLFSCSA